MLRLLYRPQNSFCIHYDAKSTDEFKEFFNSIANCRGNVIIASRQERVVWGHYSVVSRSQTLYLEKQRGKGLVKLPWQIGSDLTGFLRC